MNKKLINIIAAIKLINWGCIILFFVMYFYIFTKIIYKFFNPASMIFIGVIILIPVGYVVIRILNNFFNNLIKKILKKYKTK